MKRNRASARDASPMPTGVRGANTGQRFASIKLPGEPPFGIREIWGTCQLPGGWVGRVYRRSTEILLFDIFFTYSLLGPQIPIRSTSPPLSSAMHSLRVNR